MKGKKVGAGTASWEREPVLLHSSDMSIPKLDSAVNAFEEISAVQSQSCKSQGWMKRESTARQ